VAGFGNLNPSSGIATAYESLGKILRTANNSVSVAYMNHDVSDTIFAKAAGYYLSEFGINLVR